MEEEEEQEDVEARTEEVARMVEAWRGPLSPRRKVGGIKTEEAGSGRTEISSDLIKVEEADSGKREISSDWVRGWGRTA